MKHLLVAVLVGVGAVAPVASAKANWSACPAANTVDPRQECSTLSVPIDYARPTGQHLDLAVSRIRTAKPGLRRGVLVLIPGGPGSPGVNRPSAYVGKLPQAVLDRYDLVSFDPRGVGASTPVSCHLKPADLTQTKIMPWPAPGGDISPSVAWAQRAAAACQANGGPVYKSISTRTEARDLDAIRQALGERRVSYWGVLRHLRGSRLRHDVPPPHRPRRARQQRRPEPRPGGPRLGGQLCDRCRGPIP